MKTITVLSILTTSLLAFSCANKDQMLTVINPDGSCYREFSGEADSSFMVGDLSGSNNLSIELDSSWKITWRYLTPEFHTNWPLKTWIWDTAHKSEVVTYVARRDFINVEELAAKFKFKKSHDWSNLKVSYSFDKKFCWFYTYYSYREIYPRIKTLDRIPMEKYMTKEEAEFWFNGKPDLLKGMNGMEVLEYVKKIEEKSNRWICHNIWDSEYDILVNNYNLLEGIKISREQLISDKDSIFEKYIYTINFEDDTDLWKCLDDFYESKAFSGLYNKKDNPLKQYEDQFNDQEFFKYFETDMEYRLIMPGKILQSGNAVMLGDTLLWNLTAYRMVYSDYEIYAKSRKVNNWAFILAGIIVLVTVGSFFIKMK